MADELSDSEMQKYDAFTQRLEQARLNVDELLRIPQLTCGQYEMQDVMKTYSLGLDSISAVKPTEFETFVFFRQFYDKFKTEIDEYNKLKQKYETNDAQRLREHYLDDNGYTEDHLARFFNPCWKEFGVSKSEQK